MGKGISTHYKDVPNHLSDLKAVDGYLLILTVELKTMCIPLLDRSFLH